MKIQNARLLKEEVHCSRYGCIIFCENLSNKTCNISSRPPWKCNHMTLIFNEKGFGVLSAMLVAGWVARWMESWLNKYDRFNTRFPKPIYQTFSLSCWSETRYLSNSSIVFDILLSWPIFHLQAIQMLCYRKQLNNYFVLYECNRLFANKQSTYFTAMSLSLSIRMKHIVSSMKDLY
jgi:hypothetical protein